MLAVDAWLAEKEQVVGRGKNVDVRGVQKCVRKLAAYAADCGFSEYLVLFIVTRDEGFKAGL
jgi:hypothetical protein